MELEFWYSRGANGYIVADSVTGDVEDILDTAGEVADKYGNIYHVAAQCSPGCEASHAA